jgi:hypothetical protein
MLTSRRLKNAAKRVLFSVHRAGLRTGVIILPNHYYVGIADVNVLRRTTDIWARRSKLLGVESDLDGQASRIREVCAPFEAEYRGNPFYNDAVVRGSGPGFGYIEAQALHGVVRHFKPRQIIEVGSGISTRCSLAATAINEREGAPRCDITCIEPHPTPWLESANIHLIRDQVQHVGFELFDALEPNSLLFIDSSHTVKVGGDVNYLMLEVLPRLRAGVIVHFHDIYLPYDYARDVLTALEQPQETALLHAFLIGNRNVEILFSLSQLHYDRRDCLSEVFPEYSPQRNANGLRDHRDGCAATTAGHFPSSIYLRIRRRHDDNRQNGSPC